MSGRYRRALLVAYAVVLLGLTLSPTPPAADALTGYNKWIHGGLFSGLLLLLYWNLQFARAAVVAAVISVAAAALIELVQRRLPYRTGDLSDFLAGVAGVGLGLLVAFVVLRNGSREEGAIRGPDR